MLNAKGVHDLKVDVPTHKISLKLISNKKMCLLAWQPILAKRVAMLLEEFQCHF